MSRQQNFIYQKPSNMMELVMRLKQKRIEESISSLKPETSIAEGAGASAPPEEPPTVIPPWETVIEEQKQISRTNVDKYGNEITYNERQLQAIQYALDGKSFVLIGAAGTGKTTCTHGMVQELIEKGIAGILSSEGHPHLQSGTPGIVVCAYTRRATQNIRRNMPEDMKANCVTIHKLLQYEPIYPEVWDEATQKMKTTMKFVPARNADNPLPTSIKTIIIEEASMPSVELFNKILDALSHPVQFIFLGDIQQLPPVFGQAILGFKMLELPVVELTEVYRQALESPIIRKAQRIISGVPIPPEELPSWNTPGKLRIIPWEKKINSDNALLTLAKFFTTQIEKGNYDPQEDMILIPYNKACGTIELNKHIANFLARRRHAKTYEVIAGFQKHYFSIGDTILYDKEDAEIVDIYQNPKYAGKPPQKESLTLDYWGQEHSASAGKDENWFEGVDIDQLLLAASDKEDRVNQASHVIKIKLTNSEKEVLIDKAGDVNLVLLGYALTVHKAQGSEWRKVFFCSHQTHSKMLQRELVYTAITRAREQLIIICEPNLFVGGIISQRYPGNTWQEKAEYFKGKLETLSENEK